MIDISTLKDRVGQELGVSNWLQISQERVDAFAEATGDRQWIHVDPVRAAVEAPFKTTIAHGFLTLSLLPALARQAMPLTGLRMAVNYGVNRVRFIAPVLTGERIRGRFTPVAVEAVGDDCQVTWQVTIEREAGDRPCAVAEWVTRYYPGGTDRSS